MDRNKAGKEETQVLNSTAFTKVFILKELSKECLTHVLPGFMDNMKDTAEAGG